MYLQMSDSNTLIPIDEMLAKVQAQTTYSKEEAEQKLVLMQYDYIAVIRDYMGLPTKPNQNQIQDTGRKIPLKSVNQEIFRQFRTTLDASMKEYRDKHPIQIEHVVDNFLQEDARTK